MYTGKRGQRMSKESKVLREMEYVKKVRRRQSIKKFAFNVVALFFVILGGWYLFKILTREIIEGGVIQSVGETIVEIVLPAVAVSLALVNVYYIRKGERKKTEEKIDEFEKLLRLLRKEEFFQYLGEKKMEVELQLNLRIVSRIFEKIIKKSRIKFYVQREGMDSLYLTVYKGSEEIWDGTVNYGFFDLCFEEVIHHETEED